MTEIITALSLFFCGIISAAGGWGLRKIIKTDKSVGILSTNVANIKVHHGNELSDLRYVAREQTKATENLAVAVAGLEATVKMIVEGKHGWAG